jgi:hypothetical protein
MLQAYTRAGHEQSIPKRKHQVTSFLLHARCETTTLSPSPRKALAFLDVIPVRDLFLPSQLPLQLQLTSPEKLSS